MKRIDSLDTLRGLAILMVTAIHCSQAYTSTSGISNLLFPFGSLGVQLFFMVSGFTMLLTFGVQFNRHVVGDFYIRRIARIAPLFWLATLGYLWEDGLGTRFWAPNGISWSEIALTLSFLHGLTPQAINSIVPGGWTIAIEMQFYLIFPLFAYLFFWRGPGTVVPYLLVILIYGLGLVTSRWVLADTIHPYLEVNEYPLLISFFYFWLPNQLLCFGFGFLLFELIENKSFNKWGAALLVGASLLTSLGLSILFLFLLSYFVMSNRISNGFLRHIGIASYAMYLLQFAVIHLVTWVWMSTLGHLPSFELGFIAVALISYGISRYFLAPWIEGPAIAFGKKLAHSK